MTARQVDIVVLANKNWEALPLVEVFKHPGARPPILMVREVASSETSQARLRVEVLGRSVEVWCVEDLMDARANKSSTWEKGLALQRWGLKPELVLAFGTGAVAGEQRNGNVIVGSSVYVHDPYVANRRSPSSKDNWTHDQLDTVVASRAEPLLTEIGNEPLTEAAKRFLRTPNGAAEQPEISVRPEFVAVSVVNVISRSDYQWADESALKSLKERYGEEVRVGSVETTHGFLRLALKDSFLYATGVANQVGRYQEEVEDKSYAQNFVAAHNAAVVVAWIIPEIVRCLARRGWTNSCRQ